MRLLCRLGPYTSGGQRLQRALIELFTVANVQRPREYDNDPIVRVEMRLDFEVRWKSVANYVRAGRLVVPGEPGDVDTARCRNPFQIVWGQPDRLQGLSWHKRRCRSV